MSVEIDIKLFLYIPRGQIINESRDLVSEIPSSWSQRFIVRATELNNKNIYVLQIGASLWYKLGQIFLLQIRANVVTNWDLSVLQIGAIVVTNWGNYYKLGQPLLQNREAMTNFGKMYYKLRQVLQIRAIITNWDITIVKGILKTKSNLKIPWNKYWSLLFLSMIKMLSMMFAFSLML